jgi:hypothetical protein
MVIFLQRTFTSLVHAHAGRTQLAQVGPKNSIRPLSKALYGKNMIKHFAIRKYFNKLYPSLKERYGALDSFTKGR